MAKTRAPHGLTFHNRHGEDFIVPSVPATEVKNSFGRILDATVRKGALVITKHDEPAAVLLSWDEFEALEAARARPLAALAGQFDDLLARMQTPAARKRLKRAFDATPQEMGKAAAAAARRRG